jgi:hypothetical protein
MMRSPFSNRPSGFDPVLQRLIIESEQLQERSALVQEHASRTSGLIARVNERSWRFIQRMQAAEGSPFDSNLEHLREYLLWQKQCLAAIESQLATFRRSADGEGRDE